MNGAILHTETLFEQCAGSGEECVREAVRLAGGAAYIVSPEILQSNVERLRAALVAQYANSIVAYSYKTNYNRVLIESARRAGALSEVVSDVELGFAWQLGIPSSEIIFNGPGKSKETLHRIMGSAITLIADSIEELNRIRELRDAGVSLRARLGIRVAPALSFQTEGSRFGVDLEDSDQRRMVRRLAQEGGLPISGVHMHITGDRSPASYLERLEYLSNVWSSLNLGAPTFLDCGGGFASAMPQEVRAQLRYEVASLEEYGEALGRKMRELNPNEDVQLICEPGTGILADVGVFATRVLDVKSVGGRSIAVVDGTYFCVNPLRSPGTPATHRIFCGSGEARASVPGPVSVYGNSCMEIDLLVDDFPDTLAIGDLLVFAQKGAYASCMAPAFIQGVPALVSVGSDQSPSLERKRTGHEHLITLN